MRFSKSPFTGKIQKKRGRKELSRFLPCSHGVNSCCVLYPRNIPLTQNEINIQNKTLYPVHLTQKKMFRCPLQSCEHKPLNNYLIKYRLNYHCPNYHNNDNKQYLFLLLPKQVWLQTSKVSTFCETKNVQ